jgi:hypothetical protein
LRQFEPGLSFIGSPSGRAGAEVRLSFGSNHDGPVVFMTEVALMAPIVVALESTSIGETEDRSWNGGLPG